MFLQKHNTLLASQRPLVCSVCDEAIHDYSAVRAFDASRSSRPLIICISAFADDNSLHHIWLLERVPPYMPFHPISHQGSIESWWFRDDPQRGALQ